MEEQLNLNILNLSTNSLLMVLIILLVLQCYGVIKCSSEGLKPWDTFDARFQQERDGPIGATPSGDSEREKILRNRQEGLTGGYDSPQFDMGIGSELPPLEETDIERTENSLEHRLHSN